MALLSISEAARVAGVARSTLHRAIKSGRLSADPDGQVDTAELLRAGYTLSRQTLQSSRSALQDATPTHQETQHPPLPENNPAITLAHQERELLRLERDLLRQTLEAAQQREHAALEREQAAREREALLLHLLEQAQQQSQRLLIAGPVNIPSASSTAHPATMPVADRGAMRRQIVALLRERPEGLTPHDIRQALQVTKPLANTCKAMERDGLLRRLEPGRYTVA